MLMIVITIYQGIAFPGEITKGHLEDRNKKATKLKMENPDNSELVDLEETEIQNHLKRQSFITGFALFPWSVIAWVLVDNRKKEEDIFQEKTRDCSCNFESD